jgi:hypothetical protein
MYREHIAIFVSVPSSGGGARRLVMAQSIRARAQSILWSAPPTLSGKEISGTSGASHDEFAGVEALFFCTSSAVKAAVPGAGVPPIEIAVTDMSEALDIDEGAAPKVLWNKLRWNRL